MTDAPHRIPEPTVRDLRNFGWTFAGVALVFGLLLLWRGRPSAPWFLGASAVFLALGAVAPGLLRPAFGPWMKFAEFLGYVNTRILLGVFFFIGMTPIGLVMRLAGKDPMQRTFRKSGSYWTPSAPHSEGTKHFLRQF